MSGRQRFVSFLAPYQKAHSVWFRRYLRGQGQSEKTFLSAKIPHCEEAVLKEK